MTRRPEKTFNSQEKSTKKKNISALISFDARVTKTRPTICKDEDGVTMLLKGLFSDSSLDDSHPLQNGAEGQVQVRPRVLSCWNGKHV